MGGTVSISDIEALDSNGETRDDAPSNSPAASADPALHTAPHVAEVPDPAATHSDSDVIARKRPAPWHHALAHRVTLVDAASIVAAAITATAIDTVHPGSSSFGGSVTVAIGATASWIGATVWSRHHDRGLAVDGRVPYASSATSAAASFVVTCVLVALLGMVFPLALLIAPFVAGIAVGLAGRCLVRRWATRRHAAGVGRRTVLVVGSSAEIGGLGPALTALGTSVEVLGACITDRPDGDASIDEILLDYDVHSEAGVSTITVLGSADSAQEIAANLAADTVLLTGAAHLAPGGLSALAWQLDRIGTSLSLLSSTNDIDDARVQREVIRGTTLVHIARPTYRGALKSSKRLVDVALSGAALVILGIPMLLIAGSSRGGALFRQERVGLGGRHFTMLKFRSMVVDAEDRLADLQEDQDAGNAVMFKMKNDPRVTRIGGLLRKTSLDELPQLINVLVGDMSLVGPRPPLPSELSQYDAVAQRRFLVKPGITGLWQVSGRSDLTWEQTVRYDRRYVENWSLAADASILARTVRAMNKGAY